MQRGLDAALQPAGRTTTSRPTRRCARRCRNYVRVTADKKSGVISVEVDDKDAKFAADLANAHEVEVTKLLGRLAVSEAQLRRAFFEKQLQDTKENLVKAEQSLQAVQEKSGVIVLDKQAEALITSAALLRAQISEREVQLRVLRTSATEQNPAVMRLNSELRGLRAELARMESSQGGAPGSAVDMPVGRHPGGGGRLRARPPRAEAAGDAARRHGAPVRDRQARRGQGRPRAAAGRRRPGARTTSRSRRAPSSSWQARCWRLLLVSAWVVVRRYVATRACRRPGSGVGLARPRSAPGASSAE